MTSSFDNWLEETRVIAILHGIATRDAVAVAEALEAAGIRILEVPLGSPDALGTIRLLRDTFGDRLIVGAGTVTDVEQVAALSRAGGQICVSHNTDGAVIRAAVASGMIALPGFSTPSEAFAAIAAGARHLKIFPADTAASLLPASKALLPSGIKLVGGGSVSLKEMRSLAQAGCSGFVLGSELYKPGYSASEVGRRAASSLAAAKAAFRPEVRVAADTRCAVGESPTWLESHQRLHWVDAGAAILHSYEPRRDEQTEIVLSQPLFGLAAAADETVIATTELGFGIVDPATGVVRSLVDVPLAPGCRFNDIAIDRENRLWAGMMHRGLLAGRGGLYCADAGTTRPTRQVSAGLGVPNGIGFSPDGTVMYLVDTLARHLLALTLSGDGVGEAVIVSDFLNIGGKPDGLAVAADGTIWVAMWGGGQVVQIGASGAVERSIAVPAPHVSSVALVDRTLFITTSRMRLSAAQLVEAPSSGALFAADL